jgi:serine/threonine protein kinase
MNHLGKYELTREIAKAPLGALYDARHPDGGMVEVKTLALADEFEPRDQAEVRKRFFREAEAAARLRHPAIRRVLDNGETDGTAWVALEKASGKPLSRFTTAPDLLDPDTALELVARAAEALDYAHRRGVVHRDIKPANLIFDVVKDRLKITDFGFAHITDAGRTRTGLVLGTPSFKSPEQLADGEVTFSSDLFSLGVTLYQLLTGKLPFRSESMVGLMQSIISLPHVPPTQVREGLDPRLDAVLHKALRKRPAKRFGGGAQMAVTLRSCARALSA